MRGKEAIAWEERLKSVFDEIDWELESLYGDRFPLHPARPSSGTTSNPEMDGLFNVGASYSPGFDSKWGPGYTVEIRLSTLGHIPEDIREKLQARVQELLRQKLPKAFPGKALFVDQENDTLRIHGDLSLD